MELVRRGLEDLETFWDLLDDHVVWDLRDYTFFDLDPIYLGREAVIKATRHYFGTWDDYSLDAEEVIDAGPSVILVLHETGRGRSSGAPIERRFAQMWTFRKGRIIRWDVFPDRAAALEAAGLSE